MRISAAVSTVVVLLAFCVLPSGGNKEACLKIWKENMESRKSNLKIWKVDMESRMSKMKEPRGRNKANVHIVNVHIGKTCGSTINTFLSDMNIGSKEIHVKNMLDISSIGKYKVILISIRNPVSRMVSAFNFHHPLSHGIIEGGGPTKHGDSRFYECFKTVEEYAQALDGNSTCGQLARHGYGHMKMGICYYVGGLRNLLLAKKHVYVIEQEHCLEQLKEAVRLLVEEEVLHVDPQSRIAALNFHRHRRNASKVSLQTTLSESGYRKLRSYLEDRGEYGIYNDLRKRAVRYNQTSP